MTDARSAGPSEPAVLVAQGDQDSRTIFASALRHHGIEVVEAATGEEAIRLVVTRPPKLVLLGFRLGNVDGWRVAEVLRGDRNSEDLLIVAVTSDARPGTRSRALDAGFDDLWTKPLEPLDLVDRVNEILLERLDPGGAAR